MAIKFDDNMVQELKMTWERCAGLDNVVILLFFSSPFPCLGDSYSSSPDSTPMGSIESLSSHSSEQNSTTKCVPSQPREKSGGIPWIASPPSSNGQKSSGLWTTSPESSSKEDATKTDMESDCQSIASVTGPENASPPVDLTKKSSYSLSGLKRSSGSSLRSIPSAEGNFQGFLWHQWFYCEASKKKRCVWKLMLLFNFVYFLTCKVISLFKLLLTHFCCHLYNSQYQCS